MHHHTSNTFLIPCSDWWRNRLTSPVTRTSPEVTAGCYVWSYHTHSPRRNVDGTNSQETASATNKHKPYSDVNEIKYSCIITIFNAIIIDAWVQLNQRKFIVTSFKVYSTLHKCFYSKSRPEKFLTSMEKTTFTLKIAGFDMKTKHKLTIHFVPSILAFHHAEWRW